MPSLQLEAVAKSTLAVPSITTWTRLEPQPRDASMERSLQAQVRDPLWMLARQWQVGEFLGADAGSPVQATLEAETQSVTTYRPGADDSATVVLDPNLPVEVHVERETPTLRLRGSVQLGMYFEGLVRGSIAGPEIVVAAFRHTFPISAAVPDPTYAPVSAVRFRALMAGRATDGEALYVSAAAVQAGQVPPVALPAEAGNPGMDTVLKAFLAYRASLFSQPQSDSAWIDDQLQYEFAMGSPTAGNNLLLNAPDFPGGHLDWYSFSLQNDNATALSNANPAQVNPIDFNFFPNHVTFRGVHDPRWWVFEDSVTDFGQLDAEHVDLAKLLVMEFALIYGGNWFSVPVPIPVSAPLSAPTWSLSRVTTLVVSDTFGIRTLIRPSEQTAINTGEAPWSMFKLSGSGTRSDFLLMAPMLGVVDDADALEEVLFLRDDMGAMAWAVEHQLQGDLDAPIDTHESYLERLKNNGPPPPPTATADGPKIYYALETPVPEYWIPMVPVQTAQGTLYLRRGTMQIPTVAGPISVQARALLLNPGKPYFVADRVIPQAGRLADRYFRRTRGADGTTYLWMARKSGAGRGLGWSGLRFDVVEDLKQPSAKPA
jgi:hypothetical protein